MEESMQEVAGARVSVAALFQGFSKADGIAMINTALTGTIRTVGAFSSVRYRVCHGMEETLDALGVQQSLVASFGSLTSLKEKVNFVQEQKLTTNTVSIVAYASHCLGTSTVINSALAAGIQSPQSSDANSLRDFFQAYGDCFISEIQTGGEYMAMYTFYSQSHEQSTKVTADIQAKGILMSGEVEMGLQTKLDSVSKSSTVRVSFQQKITGITNPELSKTKDDCISFALSFPQKPLDAPVIMKFDTTGYEFVPGILLNFKAIAENRNKIAGTHLDNEADSMPRKLFRIKELINAIEELKNIYRIYVYNDVGDNSLHIFDEKLWKVETEAHGDQRTLRNLIKSYLSNPLLPVIIPSASELPSLLQGTPFLNYQVQVKGRGLSNNPAFPVFYFDDVGDSRFFIQQLTRISRIELNTATNINNLSVSYSNRNDETTRVQHGSGDRFNELFNIVSPQHARGMSITYAHLPRYFIRGSGPYYVLREQIARSLHFQGLPLGMAIADGKSLHPVTTIHDSVVIPNGSCLLGFRGHSNMYLNELQLIVAHFHPASWSFPPT